MAVETPPTITTPPTPAPQRGDRNTFKEAVDAFITWLYLAVSQFTTLAENVYANALDAFGSASAAQQSKLDAQAAASAAVNAPGTTATSATSMQLGYGSKAFTLAQTGKAYAVGQYVNVASTADPRDVMSGPITAFNAGTGAITVNVANVNNASPGVFPTVASWAVSVAGAPAQTSQEQLLSFTPVPMAALDMNLAQGEYFTKTIAGNSAFTFSNVPQGKAWTLRLTITSGMVSLPASVRWPADSAPVLATGKTHLLMFETDDAGATVRAAAIINYSA